MGKLDIKSMLVIVLLGFALFFGYKSYFSEDQVSKNMIEQLEVENDQLKEDRENNNKLISTLKLEISNLSEIIELKESIIISLDEEVSRLDNEVKSSKRELYKLRKELQEKLDKIEELKENPIERDGDDLLNSLRGKLK